MSLVVDSKMEDASDLEDLVSMKENVPPATRTVIFLDWDDTLLCSSVLANQGIKLDSDLESAAELVSQLEELSDSVIGVLTVAMAHGTVYIVTNGETGWVQLSAQKFLPSVVPFLDKLRVLSARSTFEPLYPDSPMKWKFHAFQDSLTREYGDNHCIRNVLSFGDSHAEREAIRAVTRGHPNTRTKSIKFAERPTIEQLQRQLELVSDCFAYITSHEADLDLCMSLSVSPTPEPEQPEAVVTYV
jgi:hypothetical protein